MNSQHIILIHFFCLCDRNERFILPNTAGYQTVDLVSAYLSEISMTIARQTILTFMSKTVVKVHNLRYLRFLSYFNKWRIWLIRPYANQFHSKTSLISRIPDGNTLLCIFYFQKSFRNQFYTKSYSPYSAHCVMFTPCTCTDKNSIVIKYHFSVLIWYPTLWRYKQYINSIVDHSVDGRKIAVKYVWLLNILMKPYLI